MEPVVGMVAPTSIHSAPREIPRTVQARVIGTTVVNSAAHVSLPQPPHAVGPCHTVVQQPHRHVVLSHGSCAAAPLASPQIIVHPGHTVATRTVPTHQATAVADLSHASVVHGRHTGAAPSSAELLSHGRLVGEQAISKEEMMHRGILMEGPPERAPGPPKPADPAGPEARNAMLMQAHQLEPIQASAGIAHGTAMHGSYSEHYHAELTAHLEGHDGFPAYGDFVSEPVQQYDQYQGHDLYASQQAAAPTTQFFTGPAPMVNPYETHVFDDHAGVSHGNPYAAEPYGDSGPAPSIQPHNLR